MNHRLDHHSPLALILALLISLGGSLYLLHYVMAHGGAAEVPPVPQIVRL